MPKRASPKSSRASSSGNSAGARPARQSESVSRAISLLEVFFNQNPQLGARGFGDQLAVGENGVRQSGAALAASRRWHFGHRLGHNPRCILRVLDEVADN